MESTFGPHFNSHSGRGSAVVGESGAKGGDSRRPVFFHPRFREGTGHALRQLDADEGPTCATERKV